MSRRGSKRVTGHLLGLATILGGALLGMDDHEAIDELSRQAEALRALVTTKAAGALLDEVKHLPIIEPRTIWYDRGQRIALSKEGYEALPEPEREAFNAMEFDTIRYYETFYGTPLASIRAFDLVADLGNLDSFESKKILDIGYGSIGQLRLLGQVGGHAVGVDIQPLLERLYSDPGDQGPIENSERADGSLRLVRGFWPRDSDSEVGDGFDLIISKNTLKKGYVTPDVDDPRYGSIDLSVSPDDYILALAKALNPGGLVMIYNIGGRYGPDGHGEGEKSEPAYLPMSDIRCPWSKEQWAEAGFEVLAIDVPDTRAIHAYGTCFGWNDPEKMGRGVMNFENDLHAMYTLLRKRFPG